MDTIETGRIIRDRIEGAGHRSILRIGPAGERHIRYANVNVDTFRHFGRLGLGAILGSKNLKAIAVIGQRHIDLPADSRSYKKVYGEIYDRVLHTDAMKKYHELGTPANILPLNELGAARLQRPPGLLWRGGRDQRRGLCRTRSGHQTGLRWLPDRLHPRRPLPPALCPWLGV